MAKVKLTKGELKKQRDSLKQFKRYLPTLQLKKQQLQMKVLESRKELDDLVRDFDKKQHDIKQWCGLLAEDGIDLIPWLRPEDVEIDFANIAGANVPIFKNIVFSKAEYDLYATPFWIDRGIEELRSMVQLIVEIAITRKRVALLQRELRTTKQRVNLFEKVKIPECKDHIRQIRIYLGDQQANAVGVSKVAKKKVELRELAAV